MASVNIDQLLGQLTAINRQLSDLIAAIQAQKQPTERHVVNGITWLHAVNRNGENYEKALAVENQGSQQYQALERMLLDAAQKGHKGIMQDDKWYFLSTQKDWIGRKPAKHFGGKNQ